MRQTLRAWKRRPGFAVSVVLALGLGIGVNCALFTVVNALLLRPLPFDRSQDLVEVTLPRIHPPLTDLARAQTLAAIGAFLPWNFAVAGAEGIRNVYSIRVTPDLIRALGLHPAAGRALTAEDFGRPIAMLSYEYWRQLGGRPDITGQTLNIGAEKYAVAGVLPADFFLSTRDISLVVPDLETGGRVIARLRPGVTPRQAQAELTAIVREGRTEVTPMGQAFRTSEAATVLVLQATVGLVLLITCFNLANLQLVRSLARRRELAIRTALGASRARLARQLMGESAMLALAGGALGLLLTRWTSTLLLARLPANISRRLNGVEALGFDGRVLLFTLGVSVVTVLLFGLAPAIGALRFDVMSRLRDTGRGMSPDRQRMGQFLVTMEVAIALTLLIGAGLNLKSLARLNHQELGFRSEGVLRAAVDLIGPRYPQPAQRIAAYGQIVSRVEAVPGVKAVGLVLPQFFPFGGPRVRGERFEIRGQRAAELPETEPRAELYTANPEYLDAIRLPLRRGRWFTSADTATSPPVAAISETVARRYWGERDPTGSAVRFNLDRPDSRWLTIIGVVGDVRNPVAMDVQPTAYRPFAQNPAPGAVLMIRAEGNPLAYADAVRNAVKSSDSTAPETRMASLEEGVRAYISPQRFTTWLIGIFAAMGLAVAAAGVYGVMRFWVEARVGEFGIRVALGAQPADVIRLVLGRAWTATAVGLAVGVAGAYALRQLIATQLVGVSPTDPLVIGEVALFLGAVALLAAWSPARRAARVDPSEALRME